MAAIHISHRAFLSSGSLLGPRGEGGGGERPLATGGPELDTQGPECYLAWVPTTRYKASGPKLSLPKLGRNAFCSISWERSMAAQKMSNPVSADFCARDWNIVIFLPVVRS